MKNIRFRSLVVVSVYVLLVAFFSARIYGNELFNNNTVRGTVFHDVNENGLYDRGIDNPLEGIAVSNGRDVIMTGNDGAYSLSLESSSVIFVIKPRGWMVALDEMQLPLFYYMHAPDGLSGKRYTGLAPTRLLSDALDFPLYPQDEPNNLKVLLFADTQPRDIQDIYYLNHDVIANLVGTDAAFGITLGDLVYNELNLFDPLNQSIAKIGIPWWNCIGNHDIDYSANDNVNARGAFYKTYGPSYYSFSWGPAHFIVLDDISGVYDGTSRRYGTGLGADQLQFIKNEFSRLDSEQLIVLLMHIPWIGASAGWHDNDERNSFISLLASRPNTISFVGHTHRHFHYFIGEDEGFSGTQPHHMISMGGVSGDLYRGAPDEYNIPHTMMTDGTPNSYGILEITGNKYKLNLQAVRRPQDFQMHIYAPDQYDLFKKDTITVTASIFNALPDARVHMRIAEIGTEIPMTKVLKEDPFRVDVIEREASLGEVPWRNKLSSWESRHLWEAKLKMPTEPGFYVIEVYGIDDWHEFSGRRLIQVY